MKKFDSLADVIDESNIEMFAVLAQILAYFPYCVDCLQADLSIQVQFCLDSFKFLTIFDWQRYPRVRALGRSAWSSMFYCWDQHIAGLSFCLSISICSLPLLLAIFWENGYERDNPLV